MKKALRVLTAIADGECEPMTQALARALKIAPATCYRIIQTFTHAGWVRVHENGRCELGLGLFPLLHRLDKHALLGREVSSVLQELTAATGVTSKVSAREGDEAITLLRVDSPHPMSLSVRPGARFHLTLGASGAVLLAALPDEEVDRVIREAPATCWRWQKPADVRRRVEEARAHRVVSDLGKYRPDIFGISAPLYDAGGQVQGSLTATGLTHGHSRKQLEDWGKLLVRKAAKLNQQIKQGKP
ncbi:MAG: IclR family transcriptional regulator [Limisphaerales bacterium]